MPPRDLTHDERRAAEAAFRGLPLDPNWSAAGRAVYEGIVSAAGGKAIVAGSDVAVPAPSPAPDPIEDTLAPLGIMTRDEAVRAGFLVDVTPLAREVGLGLPVGLTKPLWELGITAGHQIPEEEQEARLRDVLMALRLFLERAAVTAPLMEFPALLSFPPETVPQTCSLYVLAHRDNVTPYSLTLLLPREASAIKNLPLN
jgi:hypothetical protein